VIQPTANHSDPRPETVKVENWAALLIVVVIFITVAGNTLLILAVSLEKKLQNATSFFLRSLAVADMLVGFLVMPVSLINIFCDYVWHFPKLLCPIWIFLDVLLSTASIMHLCAISLDRYVGICNPIKYTRSNSLFKAKVKIALVWTLSILISLPIPVIGLYNDSNVFDDRTCVLNERRFVLVASFVAFFIPLIIMVVSYCLTIRVLQRQASAFLHGGDQASVSRPVLLGITPPPPQGDCLNLLQQDSGGPESSTAVDASEVSVSQEGRRDPGGSAGRPCMAQSIKNERRASKVLGVVFFLFLVMWCPFFITNVLSALCEISEVSLCNKSALTVLLRVFVWVGYVSSGVNPLVYTLFNRTYRHAFQRYLKCIYVNPTAKSSAANPVFPVCSVPPVLSREGTNNGNLYNGKCMSLKDGLRFRGEDEGSGMLEKLVSVCPAPVEHISCV
uniref:G-protein coupled receptors family 1 profile domain-containing protein n=1 Tax=Esox lucius TaxID=8010 RepID=A0A3P8XKF4_ESOLU